MASRAKDFKQGDVVKALLWCARHCCFCGKSCSTGIEVAHIDPDGTNTLDNAIPLCFDCHERIGSYNPNHPKGRSHRPHELKTRRDQVYEQYTSHLLPNVLYELTQERRKLPDVGFQIRHLGGVHPVRVRVRITIAQGGTLFGPPCRNCHYDGAFVWNLNPGFGVNGHFLMPQKALEDLSEPVRARIDVTVIDIYGHDHRLLPIGYVHNLGAQDDWYLEPSEQALNIDEAGGPVR